MNLKKMITESRNENSMEYFKEIKPEFVISEIEKILKKNNLIDI